MVNRVGGPLTPVLVDLVIDRPVAGGRMLARHEGRIVLVAGAIPGERVRVQITRTTRHVAWADVVEVLDASPDRRLPTCDLACGGSSYAHIGYPRQLQLKSEVVADAFRRIGKMTLDRPTPVEPSAEHGYRLRARLQVRDRRAGFLREGTHEWCDAGATGQLLPDALAAVNSTLDALGDRLGRITSVTLAENLAATERVLHLDAGAPLEAVASLPPVGTLTGITTMAAGRTVVVAGGPTIRDTAGDLFGREAPIDPAVAWTRHATSFFQGNRFLAGALVARMLGRSPGGRFVDLYSGVGLFAIALAARGGQVLAVEGDRSSGADLACNAEPWGPSVQVLRASVEDVVAQSPVNRPDVVVLDPPRTGVSPEALRGLLSWRVPRLVYVSCDPPTLARDAARIGAAGYVLESIEAFDFFPNTPHVEVLAVFQRT